MTLIENEVRFKKPLRFHQSRALLWDNATLTQALTSLTIECMDVACFNEHDFVLEQVALFCYQNCKLRCLALNGQEKQLDQDRLNETHVEQIKDIIKSAPCLRELHLTFQNFDETAYRALRAAVLSHPTLSVLNIAHNPISRRGFKLMPKPSDTSLTLTLYFGAPSSREYLLLAQAAANTKVLDACGAPN